jgi:hypothetical protein
MDTSDACSQFDRGRQAVQILHPTAKSTAAVEPIRLAEINGNVYQITTPETWETFSRFRLR